jgi:hypothetical protein
MVDNQKYRDLYIAACQEHVGDPVRAVAVLSRPGAMTRMGVLNISPLASGVMGMSAKKQAGGLPHNVILAVTDSALHVFDYSPKRNSVKIKGEVATWNRADLQVKAADGKLATTLTFEFSDGGQVQLEANNMGLEFNVPGIQAMGAISGG